MATVTELLDRASRITGLRNTGTERTIALQALQNAYRRVVMDAEATPANASYTFVAKSDTYSLATLCGATPVRLLHVGLQSSGGRMNLEQTSMQELMDYRQTENAEGIPCLYATIGFSDIAFYPSPAVGDRLSIWYLADTPTLVESGPAAGQESTPSKVPVAFHWDLLLPGMVLEMLDKDQRSKDVDFWAGRYERGLQRFQDHIGQMGGEANRAYVAIAGRRPFLRDERQRW